MADEAPPRKDAWYVAAEGKSYGPYTDDQLKSFIGEGRVTAATPVMRAGEVWSLAREHQALAWIFAAPPPAPEGAPPPMPALPAAAPPVQSQALAVRPSVLRQPATAIASASADQAAAAALPTAAASTATASPTPSEDAPLNKIMIIAELRTGSSMAFENAIAGLGNYYRMNQFVWLVHTSASLSHLSKDLAFFAGKHDPIFIADTTHGRAVWINFGPGAAATINALWKRAAASQAQGASA